jgi:hypothetical protein
MSLAVIADRDPFVRTVRWDGVAARHQPIAVMLDLIDPVRSRWRPLGGRREAGFDMRGAQQHGADRAHLKKESFGAFLGARPVFPPPAQHRAAVTRTRAIGRGALTWGQ